MEKIKREEKEILMKERKRNGILSSIHSRQMVEMDLFSNFLSFRPSFSLSPSSFPLLQFSLLSLSSD